MKRTVILLLISGFVLVTGGLWFVSVSADFKLKDIIQFAVIILLIGFALFAGIRRFASIRRGEPAEDELSKKVLHKTAAWSYYISLYLWLAIMYIEDKGKYESHVLLAAGIVGMAITFAICWVIFKFKGFRNE